MICCTLDIRTPTRCSAAPKLTPLLCARSEFLLHLFRPAFSSSRRAECAVSGAPEIYASALYHAGFQRASVMDSCATRGRQNTQAAGNLYDVCGQSFDVLARAGIGARHMRAPNRCPIAANW